MIDRLELAAPCVPYWWSADGEQSLPATWWETRPISQYRTAHAVYADIAMERRLATIATNPIHATASPAKVIVNCHDAGFLDCVWWPVLQTHWPELLLGQWRINRLDLTLDVAGARPVDVAGQLRDNPQRKWHVYSSRGYVETIYAGDDPLIRLYDKGLEDGGLAGAVARIEIQLRDKAPGHPANLRDLYERGEDVLIAQLGRTCPLAATTVPLTDNQQLYRLKRNGAYALRIARRLEEERAWHRQFTAALWQATAPYARAYWQTKQSLSDGPG